MHALVITEGMSSRAKATFATFNATVAHLELSELMSAAEILNGWKSVKYPMHIWELVNETYELWASSRAPQARELLEHMAMLWSCGARDTTGALKPHTATFLARLALVMEVHNSLQFEFEDESLGAGSLGWIITCYIRDTQLEAPLPRGASSWGSYIASAVIAARCCENGQVAANVRHLKRYLETTGLPYSLLDLTSFKIMRWVTQEARQLQQVGA